MKKNAILLVRVSSLEQDYEAQIHDLKQYGQSLGYIDFHVVQTKETAFADLSQKVGTNDMFKYIEENPSYNTVFTTEISRLARRQSILHQIKEHCVTRNIQIIIKDMDFRLFDNDGKVNQQSEMIFALFGMFAENEVKQKLERFTRKRKELMQMGLSISGKLLFGYDRFKLDNNKNTLIINEDQAKIIRTIFNWYLNGLNNVKNPSIKAISIECIKRGFHPYTHSKRNVNKLLKEEAYTGNKITNNKRKNPKFGLVINEPEYLISSTKIKYPIIIETELFKKVKDKLRSNITKGDKETKHITILSKLLNCPSCHRKMQGNYRKSNTGYKNSYRCTSRSDSTSCASVGKSLSMNLIDSAIWSFIKTDLPELSRKINEINPDEYLVQLNNHLLNLVEREKQVQNSIDENLAILKSVGRLTSTGVLQLIEDTAKKIERLENELSKIRQEKSSIESNKLLIYDKQSDIATVINQNIVKIESSKEMLKKYVNSFVDHINILEHNMKYTVLEVVIKDFSIRKEYTDYFGDKLPIQLELGYIVLDKTITRNIIGVCFKAQTPSTDYSIFNSLVTTQMIPLVINEMNSYNGDIQDRISVDLKFKKLLL
ncbi:recombinase family protein [Flavobacterium plurextorum]|uniref:recombinase family protein n=1 Tax=Flavobacterium TaxID=237 RepID=UPI00214DCA3C|nr:MULTISPECIES: recombinase family protein [Flavobacterium]UUW11335.1 recombinase family protein [Flavobacterium plurextorum]